MRQFHLTCFVLISLSLSAQNWALLDPANKYDYALGGSDTITDQVFIEDIDTLGPNDFWYALNTIAERCDTCADGHTAFCHGNMGGVWVRAGLGGFMRHHVHCYNGTWTLEGLDTLIVYPEAAPGTTWMGPSSVTATVEGIEEGTVLGVTDSLKWISFSTGDTITISKDHGLVRWRIPEGDAYALIGIQGNLALGERFPDMQSLFNYTPGDVLQYHHENWWTDGMCTYADDKTIKYIFLSRTENTESTVYSVREVWNLQHTAFPLGGEPSCGPYSAEGVDTVQLVITHDHWTPENFLGNSWLDHCWPKALAERALDDWTSEYSTVWRARLDDQQRYVLEPDTFTSEPVNGLLLCRSDQDSAVWATQDYGYEYVTYVDGIGLLHYETQVFEHAETRDLVGYELNGEEWGTITPDDIVLGMGPSAMTVEQQVFPNPADDHLVIGSTHADGTCRLLDLHGRVLSSHIFMSPNERLDVRDLSPGTYVLMIDGSPPQRFIIAR
jgi:hypothetical protein